MGFTVTGRVGANGMGYEAYVRLLRQQGKGLANLPRVPNPNHPKRWAHVWETRQEAQHFADELREETGDDGWQVIPTDAPPLFGPFGPVLIQMARNADGLEFALHPLSRAMIQELFPDVRPGMTNAFTDTQTWTNFLKARGDLQDLVEGILPPLTGLNLEQVCELGYAVSDADDDRTWVEVAPAAAVPSPT